MYPDPQSQSARLFERGQRVIPGGNTRESAWFTPYPVYGVSGRGCRVTDVEGVERIDFINNWSSLIHGHGNPAVIEAIIRQAQESLAIGVPTIREIELAEIICDRLPGVEQVRFSNSGSEGVLFAIRAARAFTGRDRIAKVEGAYHGNYDPVEVSVAPGPGDWGPPQRPASVPACEGIPRSVLADTVVIPYNDVDKARAILQSEADELAAVLIDPLVPRMGFTPAKADYLAMIRELTAANGIVLIFDEVFSFRVGYNGAQGRFGVIPDLTALGKVIGGGMPVGATGGKKEIMAVFDHSQGASRTELSGTFSGNPMTMAAGRAALEQLTPDAFDRLDALGEQFRTGLREALSEAGLPGKVQGMGSLSCMGLSDKTISGYRDMDGMMGSMPAMFALHRHLLNNGVLCVPYGLYIISTAMQPEDIDEALQAFRSGLKAIAEGGS